VLDMVSQLFSPWRGNRLWPTFCFSVLDLIFGGLVFAWVVALVATGVSLLITLPLALPVVWLLFTSSRGLGWLERSRANALLGLELTDPHPPLPPSSMEPWVEVLPQPARWGELAHLPHGVTPATLVTESVTRFVARLRSFSRWKEVFWLLVAFPIGLVTSLLLAFVWSTALLLATLPLYLGQLPGDSAELVGSLQVRGGVGLLLATLAGLSLLVFVAPWLTVGVRTFDRMLARNLLGPAKGADLALARATAAAERAERGRTAAVDAAEAERRRIERDLHDGAQQRLVSLAMDLGMATERFDEDPEGARRLVEGAHGEALAALTELRDLVRGLHPAIIEDRGLDAALSAVVARVPVPVDLQVDVGDRPSAPVESAAYFVVSEALTNVTRHADASRVSVAIARRGDRLAIDVTDDGVGGADPARGSGLKGLEERVRSLDGWMTVLSPDGGPTTVLVELPCGPSAGAGSGFGGSAAPPVPSLGREGS
jgi:signal transduction histidine kinase